MKINQNNVLVLASAFLLSEGFRTTNILMIIAGIIFGVGAIFNPIDGGLK